VPIRLTDTAGLRDTSDRVEAIGVERAGRLANAADVLVWLGAPDEAPEHARLLTVQAKADLPGRAEAPEGSLAASAHSGVGLQPLLEAIEHLARSVLPAEDAIALNRRQAGHLAEAREALAGGSEMRDLVLLAEQLRVARGAFDRLTGRAGVEDVLDALFGRFCLGK
jgi:tRNA modification GTPase